MSKRDLSPDSLEAQADALLAAADSMDIPDEIPMPGKSSRSHTADEFIFIQEIEEAIELYLKLLDGAVIHV